MASTSSGAAADLDGSPASLRDKVASAPGESDHAAFQAHFSNLLRNSALDATTGHIYLSDFDDENKCLVTYMHYIDRTKIWVRRHDGAVGAAAAPPAF